MKILHAVAHLGADSPHVFGRPGLAVDLYDCMGEHLPCSVETQGVTLHECSIVKPSMLRATACLDLSSPCRGRYCLMFRVVTPCRTTCNVGLAILQLPISCGFVVVEHSIDRAPKMRRER